MKPSDFYLKKEERKQEESIIIPNDTYLFAITKHAPHEKFSNCVDMQFQIDEGSFKGSNINVLFFMTKKIDGSVNQVAKRIYSEICDEAVSHMPDEFYELLGKKVYLNCKSNATEKGVYYNVSVPYKKKDKQTKIDVNNVPIVNNQINDAPDNDDDIPF